MILTWRKCPKCNLDKPLSEFYLRRSNKIKKNTYQSWCKDCTNRYNKEHKGIWNEYMRRYRQTSQSQISRATYEQTSKCKAIHATYRKNNREKIAAQSAKRHCAKLQRIPKWADLNAIKQFYINRPKGMTVDHIVPLQGKLVSGLHVLNNLQYLTLSENSKKGRSYPWNS